MSDVPPWERPEYVGGRSVPDPRETIVGPLPGASETPEGATRPVHPPVRFLAYGGVAVLLAALLLLFSGNGWRIAGYLLGTIVAIGAVTLFRREDVKRRSSRSYAPREHLAMLATTIVVVGFGLAVVHVWFLADDLARR